MSYQDISESLERDLDILQAEGAVLPDAISTFEGDEERVTVLQGFPPCPICFHILRLRAMPVVDDGKMQTPWFCPECGTQWETSDLIQAMNMEV